MNDFRNEPPVNPAAPGRREFIKMAAGAAAASLTARSYSRVLGANDRIRFAVVGTGGRGMSHVEALAGPLKDQSEIAFICDVYEPHRAAGLARAGGAASGENDYRRLLEKADLDAFLIAAPDHWHARMLIDACRAGKDVYVEKPLSVSVREGRAMIKTARETGRVTQMGTQRHSSPYVVEACRRMREGEIGRITAVRCFHIENKFPKGIGPRVESGPPPGLDWDLWLGPAPKVPFATVLWNFTFRYFWRYSGGFMTDTATHWLDLIHMGIGQERPLAVAAMGGKFAVDDARETPDTMEAVWTYKDCLVSFRQSSANASPGSSPGSQVEFRGTLGTLTLFHDRFEIVPEAPPEGEGAKRGSPLAAGGPAAAGGQDRVVVKGQPDGVAHLRNFIDCMRSRSRCNCDVETGHLSTVATHIGNIAYRTGELLRWNAEAEDFVNGSEAARALLDCEYRPEWRLET